jgi:homopolymeric O-antigen transport system ATP-binding protein
MSSNDLAVSVRGLSKSYIIAHNSGRPTNFREVIVDRLRHPFGNGRQKRETFWAIKDVNFDIVRGESVAIIGRNGAGKSTLLKLLSRITYPATGSIDIYGHLASLLEVGTGFHGELTGRENIYLNGSILGMRRREIERRFDEIVEFSGVEQFLDTPVKRYSSGMYVRLAFAVAAHLEPDILVVDEVLSVGDAAFQKKCMGKMTDVLQQGRTILFVSHNMSAVSNLCTRVILMKQGRMTFDGPTAEGLTRYVRAAAVATSVDLSTTTNRRGPREYGLISSVSLFDSAGRPCDNFAMGEAVIVEMEIDCIRRLYPAEVGFVLINGYGTTIHYFVSAWEGLHLDLQPGRHRLRVTIPQVLVHPGTYALSLWLKRQGLLLDDQVDEAIQLVVHSADVTGHNPYFERYSFSKAEVYCPSEWTHTAVMDERQHQLSRGTHD